MSGLRTAVYYRVKLICKDTLPDGCSHWSEELLEGRYSDYADAMSDAAELIELRPHVQFAYPVRCREVLL